MARDTDGPLLSPEEMRYLGDLFQKGATEAAARGRARLELDPAAPLELARYLKGLGPMALTADPPGRRLRFPLEVAEDEGTGLPYLLLRYPEVVERHPAHDRSLRVRPAPGEPVALTDPSGLLTAPQVLDLSASGLSLIDRTAPGLTVGAELPGLLLGLPAGVITLDARVVREALIPDASPAARRIALALSADDGAREALQAYIYRRYAEDEGRGDADPFLGDEG